MRRACSPPQFPPRARPWLWALGLSVAAHGAWLLDPAPVPREAVSSASPARPLSTRSIEPPPRALPAAPRQVPPLAPAKPRPAARLPAAPPAAPAEEPTSASPELTRIAPAADWTYQLRHKGKLGTARLSWQPQDGGYRLRLDRELDGRALPGWRSEGGFDAQGLAPQRYATQHQGRDSQATNFRRDEGLISFSASPAQIPLAPGVQDRISWWLQLGARVAGAPQRYGPGSEIRLSVVGLRGEALAWVFEVVGEAPLSLPDQRIAPALHLRRAALGAYDPAIDIWLDPSRGHLPVKLAAGRPEEQGWELQLIDDKPAPARQAGNRDLVTLPPQIP